MSQLTQLVFALPATCLLCRIFCTGSRYWISLSNIQDSGHKERDSKSLVCQSGCTPRKNQSAYKTSQHSTYTHPKSEPPLRAASGSQEDPEHLRQLVVFSTIVSLGCVAQPRLFSSRQLQRYAEEPTAKVAVQRIGALERQHFYLGVSS